MFQYRVDRLARRLCRENPSMSLMVVQAHFDEMVHDLVKELQASNNKGRDGEEQGFNNKGSHRASSPCKGY
jgi:hypothetical protein